MMARPRGIIWLAGVLVALNGAGAPASAPALAGDPDFLPRQWGLFLLKLGGVMAGLRILNPSTSGLWLFGLVVAAGLAAGLSGAGRQAVLQPAGAILLFLVVGPAVAAIVWPHPSVFRGWPARLERPD